MAVEEGESAPLRPSQRRQKGSGWTSWLIYATVVCVMGSSFQFGYNSSCINAPEKDIETYFKEHHRHFSEFEWAITVAIFAVGGMIGALGGPSLANWLGRKRTLLYNNVPAITGAVLMFISYFTKSPALLIIGRFIVGLNCGVNTAVAPMYLSEIAPIQLRGSLGTLNQFGIVFGLLIGFVFGLKEVLGSGSRWPYLLGFSVIPAVFQILTLPCCPCSPRYLLLKLNEEAAAVRALQVLRGTTDVSDDIVEMRVEQERELREERISIVKLFKVKSLQKPLLIGVVMQMAQQLSGISAVFYYSTSIFERAKVEGSRYSTVAVGIVGVIMTAITVKLVEVLGRRTLMLIGLGGMFVFYAVMTLAFCLEKSQGMSYVAVVATLILVVFFQLGPGPIPWFITAEMFSQGPRTAACTVAAAVNWIANFIVGIAFPSMQKALYPYTFLVFMGLLAGFWIFTYVLVPETKGRTIEDITDHFRNGNREAVDYSRVDSDEET